MLAEIAGKIMMLEIACRQCECWGEKTCVIRSLSTTVETAAIAASAIRGRPL